MASDKPKANEPGSDAGFAGKPLPAGYRQGVVTAISVILGFALYFLRFWSIEAPGDWTWISVIAAVPIVLSIVCLAVALWRSLQVEDDDEPVYRKTLKWFLAGVMLAVIGVLASAIALSGIFASE
jgi:hypothetical protein